MTEFVKICPKCKHHNPEYATVCERCTYFIGMEQPTTRPRITIGNGETTPPTNRFKSPPPTTSSQRTSNTPCFYLEVIGETYEPFLVYDGDTLGQAHPTSSAEVQIPAAISGYQYLHRRHCRFEFRDRAWQVTSIDQQTLGRNFTNPTQVNQHALAPGECHTLNNGDRLGLSGVLFQVRML